MAAFRKFGLALAVLVLIGLGTANAQTAAFQCTANAGVPPILRSEGLTELTGDIVLNCTGGTSTPAGTAIPTANFSIFLNTAVTSRILDSATTKSEALLLIDEPVAAEANLCTTAPTCAVTGTGGLSNPFKGGTPGLATGKNIWQGTVSGNSVTFIGVPVEPPGTVGTRIYRFTNIRANASAVAPGGFGTPGQVVALISATPATAATGLTSSFPINNPSQIVGFVQSGLTFAVNQFGNLGSTSTPTINQCENFRISSTVPRNLVSLRFTEGFATSFKPRTAPPVGTPFPGTEVSGGPYAQDVPGLIYNSESGYYNPALTGATTAGLADFGTRLRVTFSGIPNGIRVFVGTTNTTMNADGRVTAVTPPATQAARLVGTETGFFFPVTSSTTAALTFGSAAGSLTYTVQEVTLTSGTGTAIWEVLSADPQVVQDYVFPVMVISNANAANNLPTPGVGNAAGSFAPAPPAFSATDGARAQGAGFPIPRFVDTGTARRILGVNICRTLLMFPFVTNQSGFDTGLAIANTTRDPLGTSPQSGTCDLNFFGANAPSVVTTAAVAGGDVYTNLASVAAPNFQGYIIAICNFQYAHGFAFVSDIGARNLAMGYLALVMPDGGRQNTNSGVSLANGTGELLGQ
jgi:hypothetical protein